MSSSVKGTTSQTSSQAGGGSGGGEGTKRGDRMGQSQGETIMGSSLGWGISTRAQSPGAVVHFRRNSRGLTGRLS